MFDEEIMMGTMMLNPAASVLKHASEIREIVLARHFKNPRVVDYDDPNYDVTLLLEPVGEVTLFDVAGVMSDIERKLALKAFVVTDDEFDATMKRSGFCLTTIPLPGNE